jgi:hypothetical protein
MSNPIEAPIAPSCGCRPIPANDPCVNFAPHAVVLHKGGKTYQVESGRVWSHGTKGLVVGVTGLRNGKHFGPWRAMKVDAIVGVESEPGRSLYHG